MDSGAPARTDALAERISRDGVPMHVGKNARVALALDAPIDLVWIDPGSFLMGAVVDRDNPWLDEGPPTPVTFSDGYWIATTPVTQLQWQHVVGPHPIDFRPSQLQTPVERVSWLDCRSFCDHLNGVLAAVDFLPHGYGVALPSEAQWEQAARAGTSTGWFFGNDPRLLDDYAWHAGNSGGEIPMVARKKPNPWGLHDMLGTVWEWTSSWAASVLPGTPQTDYRGPSSGTYRVFRGGSWFHPPRCSRCASRSYIYPTQRGNSIGFRVAITKELAPVVADDEASA